MSPAPCWGQFTKSRDNSPLDTRESKTGCTTPLLPVRWPSDGPSDPASESPPIQSRNGSPGVRGVRHVCAGAAPGAGALVGPAREAPRRPWSSCNGPVTAYAVPAASSATATPATRLRRQIRRRRDRWPRRDPLGVVSSSDGMDLRLPVEGARPSVVAASAAAAASRRLRGLGGPVELGAVQVGVQPALSQELDVPALLDDAALAHPEDPVGPPNRPQPAP